MRKFSLNQTLVNGFTLAVPLIVILYILAKVVITLQKVIGPLAERLHINRIFGEVTLTILACIILLIFIFFLGVLMYIPVISKLKDVFEDWMLRLIPSLNQLKLLMKEKFERDSEKATWRSVLVLRDNEYAPAYVTEENDQWVSIAFIKAPHGSAEDMIVVRKTDIEYKEVPMSTMIRVGRLYGKGLIRLVENLKT
ncbi:hypothetical protein [Pollutibacter soli]|uniref:hypothetical protein n=1 Tax=Pollutibacter soli TaxID=3034157 RepID=UPI003013D93A